MIEPYVVQVMNDVSKYCQDKEICEGLFWGWLGNNKFKQDNGNLTPDRASFISKNIDFLFKEYKGATI